MTTSFRMLFVLSVSFCAGGVVFVLMFRLFQKSGGRENLKYVLQSTFNPGYQAEITPRRDSYFIDAVENFNDLLPKLGPGSVLLLGDSITSRLPPHLLTNNARIGNLGIDGDTTLSLLQRIAQAVKAKPSAMFIMVGGNDFGYHYTPEQTVGQLVNIITAVRRGSPETVIYAQSILPSHSPAFNKWARQVNSRIKNICDGGHVIYLDLYDHFLNGETVNAALYVDGEHLNLAGNRVLAGLINKLVEKHTSQPRARWPVEVK